MRLVWPGSCCSIARTSRSLPTTKAIDRRESIVTALSAEARPAFPALGAIQDNHEVCMPVDAVRGASVAADGNRMSKQGDRQPIVSYPAAVVGLSKERCAN